jgi:predicted TIM-barrel fold metal-dependent hydrolase
MTLANHLGDPAPSHIPPVPAERLVDVHSHFIPPGYADEAIRAGHTLPDGMPAWPAWDVDTHLRMMDAATITQSVLSLSSPGVHFGEDDAAIARSRRVNDFAAGLQRDHPDRFQFFACLPIPVIDASLTELTRSIDLLGAAGIVLETNVHGQYLSHPDFEPLWAALDERAATVFLHPTSPPGWEQTALGLPRPLLEFSFDTTRAIVGLMMAGVFRRFPNVRVIVPHVGQLLPAIIDRVDAFTSGFAGADKTGADKTGADKTGAEKPESFAQQLRHLWFDLAGTPMPRNAGALIDLVGPDHIVYGSDYCFTPAPLVNAQIHALDLGWPGIDTVPWRTRTTRNVDALLDRSELRSTREGENRT